MLTYVENAKNNSSKCSKCDKQIKENNKRLVVKGTKYYYYCSKCAKRTLNKQLELLNK